MIRTLEDVRIVCRAGVLSFAAVAGTGGCFADLEPGSGDVADKGEVDVVAQAATGYTTNPCTTVTADARLSLGTGAIPAQSFNSPSATYGRAGCENRYVVEIYNTLGNFNELYLAANWKNPLPTDEVACEASWVRFAHFGKFASGRWYQHSDKTVYAVWDQGLCVWPNSTGAWPTPETFYTFTPANQYQKLRIAVQAGILWFQLPAQAYIWPVD